MLITAPQNRSIDENQGQTFTCSATRLQRPNITWTLNGTEIMTGATFTIANQISADNTTINSTLSFTAVSGAVSGNGQYNCVATNTQALQAIASATLQVFSKSHHPLPLTLSVCQYVCMYVCLSLSLSPSLPPHSLSSSPSLSVSYLPNHTFSRSVLDSSAYLNFVSVAF